MNALFRAVGVSKQAYHQQAKRNAAAAVRAQGLFQQADRYRAEHPGCGVEKLYYTLNPEGIGRDRYCDLLLSNGYRVQRRVGYPRTTVPVASDFNNLIEGMLLCRPDQVWQSDITYFRLGEKFGYIVFIIDIYTRSIVGFSVSDNMRAEANVQALKMAIRARGSEVAGLIHHSDRGSQYASRRYVTLLQQHGIHVSMGQKAPDNAYAERVNGIIKNEYLGYWTIRSLADLRRYVRRAVQHYNSERIHRSLPSHLSPAKFEQKVVTLPYQKRPTVIVYAEGNQRTPKASSRGRSWPEKTLLAPACPIATMC